MTTMATQVEGLRSVSGSTERDALFPSPATGQKVYNQTTRAVEEWSGTAWLRALGGDHFDVRRFGAIGDGITPDDVAVQAAITACRAAGGGEVFVPRGAYLLSTALTFGPSTLSEQDVVIRLRGEGDATQFINACSTNTPCFNMLGVSLWTLSDFMCVGNDSHLNDGIHVDVGSGGASIRWRIERVHLRMAGYGIKTRNVNSFEISGCRSWSDLSSDILVIPQSVTPANIKAHVYLTGDYAHDGTIRDFDGCQGGGAYPVDGLLLDAINSLNLRVYDGLYEGSTSTVSPVGITLTGNVYGAIIDGPYMEGATLSLQTCNACTVRGMTDGNGGAGGGTSPGAIVLGANVQDCVIQGCNTDRITINGSAIRNTLIGCRFTNAVPGTALSNGATSTRFIGVMAAAAQQNDTGFHNIGFDGALFGAAASLFGRIAHASGDSVAAAGAVDMTALSSGGNWTGLLVVSNTKHSDATFSTRTVYLVVGTTGAITFTSIGTTDGAGGAYAFTPSFHALGVIRITNNGAAASDIRAAFFGTAG